jgi:hypothetical protein
MAWASIHYHSWERDRFEDVMGIVEAVALEAFRRSAPKALGIGNWPLAE